MKKLTLTALAVLTVFAIAPAQGSGKMGSTNMGKAHMQHGNMAHGMKMGQMGAHECCMMGLTASEKKSAMAMMKGWDASETAAWDARCSMCMKDPHTALMKMDHSKVTEAMVHQHMMSGLNKSQMAAMNKILADKKDAGVMHKMLMNCCTYGMQHAHKLPVAKTGRA